MTAELPPRPQPPRHVGDTVHAWLAWFGVARLIVSALCVVVVAAGVAWLVRAPAPATEAGLPLSSSATSSMATMATLPPPPTAAPAEAVLVAGPALVHVAGAVVDPGVYEIEPGGRVHAAIEAAGGPSSDADLDGLNLAAPVADGQRIYVPVVGEVVSSVILLQLVPEQQRPVHSGAHVDLFTDDVSRAVEQASAIGATLVRPAGFYPDHDPMLSDEKPLLEWAVMADPFGNEFCLVTHA